MGQKESEILNSKSLPDRLPAGKAGQAGQALNPKIYFLEAKKISPENLASMFDAAGFKEVFKKDDLVAVKVHFGEPGNKAYLKPQNVKPLAEKLKSLGTKPFLTDANTLYKGKRSNSVDHIETARSHGYDFLPVIIADGLNGKDFEKIAVRGKHFKEVNIASAAVQADSMLVMTHFKGHELTGFGGAIKNLGMGLGSRSGKQQMHSDVKPQVEEDKCTGCGLCVKWCPASAIGLKDKKASIDRDKCIGCAECVVTCQSNAIEISWAGSPASVQEKMAEYALGAVNGKRCAYFSFAVDISPNCDCYGFNDPPIVGDIGVLAGSDPVAMDQACIDLAKEAAGTDIIKKTWPLVDHDIQLEHAERIGLGLRKYEIIRL